MLVEEFVSQLVPQPVGLAETVGLITNSALITSAIEATADIRKLSGSIILLNKWSIHL